ncbi:MAG: hypothetical protein ACTHM1_05845 [Solirubrobacteraceae bacterium]
MPQAAQARAWWADVEDVRARIERRRARESEARGQAGANASAVRAPAMRRGVREVHPGRHLMVVPSGVPAPNASGVPAVSRRRPQPRMTQRLGPRPDRVAAWAVVLGFASVIAAVLSAHG